MRGAAYLSMALLILPSLGGNGASAQQAPAVTVFKVEQRDVTPSTSFTGRIEAMDKVDLRARVEGFLEQQLFTEGQEVKAGDLLFVIEKAPYKAEIENVEAAIARAQATLDLAELERRRQAELVKKQATAQARLDDATAASGEARADLRRQQANLTTAELNLGYTEIRAPIAGRVGRSNFGGRQLRRTAERHAGHDRQPGSDVRDLPGHAAPAARRAQGRCGSEPRSDQHGGEDPSGRRLAL